CRQIAERREVRALNQTELQAFISAVQEFHSGPSPTGYDRFANLHATYFSAAHNNAAFFPWHRKFLKDFEAALQNINPSVQLPYWDWSLDSQSPAESQIFSGEYFGGDGDASNGYCVSDGPFSNWIMRYPNVHCLRRQFNGADANTIGAFYSPEALRSITGRSRSYDALRRNIESPPHGAVHVGIGGRNGDMAFATSTNDPLFWLHHAFVDKIWADWQKSDPSRFNDYGGVGPGNTQARLTDSMRPFQVTVSSMMDTTKPGLCYRY
ncbi:Di-copper centre-containing protein, partial [Basidiobolus meristosporus CBS 931.73]